MVTKLFLNLQIQLTLAPKMEYRMFQDHCKETGRDCRWVDKVYSIHHIYNSRTLRQA